jgi:hypothetical protein
MSKNSFLNYYKIILEKVSFDQRLVEKEYRKAKRFLTGHEVQELDNWIETMGIIDKSSPPVEKFGFGFATKNWTVG